MPELLDRAGRRRSPATMPEFHAGRPPGYRSPRRDGAICLVEFVPGGEPEELVPESGPTSPRWFGGQQAGRRAAIEFVQIGT
jgi:hypothetical protein